MLCLESTMTPAGCLPGGFLYARSQSRQSVLLAVLLLEMLNTLCRIETNRSSNSAVRHSVMRVVVEKRSVRDSDNFREFDNINQAGFGTGFSYVVHVSPLLAC